MRIEGAQVNLREIDPSDLERMVRWRNESRRYFFYQRLLTMEGQRAWYGRYLEDNTDLMFVIETREGIPVGTVGINKIDLKRKTGEFGRMMIGEGEYRCNGLGGDTTMTLLRYAFCEMGLERMYLEVLAFNTKAIELYKRCGFKQEGGVRTRPMEDGAVCEYVAMAISKEQLDAQRADGRCGGLVPRDHFSGSARSGVVGSL